MEDLEVLTETRTISKSKREEAYHEYEHHADRALHHAAEADKAKKAGDHKTEEFHKKEYQHHLFRHIGAVSQHARNTRRSEIEDHHDSKSWDHQMQHEEHHDAGNHHQAIVHDELHENHQHAIDHGRLN